MNEQNRKYYTIIESPVDPLMLVGNGEHLNAVFMDGDKRRLHEEQNWVRDDGLFAETKRQLLAYFGKELTTFSLPLDLAGTDFQRKVWSALLTIPHGQTASYLDIAKKIKSPKAVRAVGLANGKNPISIIVPCHRVIGSNGKLTGYAGGIPRKQWLLEHEANQKGLFGSH